MEALGDESDTCPDTLDKPCCWEAVENVKMAELLDSFKSQRLTFLSKPALATQFVASVAAKHLTKSAWFPSVCILLKDVLCGFHSLIVLSDEADTTN